MPKKVAKKTTSKKLRTSTTRLGRTGNKRDESKAPLAGADEAVADRGVTGITSDMKISDDIDDLDEGIF